MASQASTWASRDLVLVRPCGGPDYTFVGTGDAGKALALCLPEGRSGDARSGPKCASIKHANEDCVCDCLSSNDSRHHSIRAYVRCDRRLRATHFHLPTLPCLG